MKLLLRNLTLALAGLLVSASPASAADDDKSFLGLFTQDTELAINFGTFGALDTEQVFEVGAEFRLRRAKLTDGLHVRPIIGGSILDDGGNYWYLGARGEIALDRHENWQLGLSFAPGIYSAGGIDLGGPVEFRSGIDLGYEIFEDVRASVGLYHLSNGGLYSQNGGAESALFSISAGL